jgi:hypothetical protein
MTVCGRHKTATAEQINRPGPMTLQGQITLSCISIKNFKQKIISDDILHDQPILYTISQFHKNNQ